jgi:hypothetical protein
MGDFIITITEPLESEEVEVEVEEEDGPTEEELNDENYVEDTEESVTSAISNSVNVNPEFRLKVGE